MLNSLILLLSFSSLFGDDDDDDFTFIKPTKKETMTCLETKRVSPKAVVSDSDDVSFSPLLYCINILW